MIKIEFVKAFLGKYPIFSIVGVVVIVIVIALFTVINLQLADLDAKLTKLDKKMDSYDSRISRLSSAGPTKLVDASKTYEQVIKATVLVINKESVTLLPPTPTVSFSSISVLGEDYGTGFFISRKGYVVTAYHVIKSLGEKSDSSVVFIVTSDGKTREAKVIKQNADKDLAILKVAGENYPFLELGYHDNVSVGDIVAIAGFGSGYNIPLIHQGIVSGKTASGPGALFTVNAFVNRGNSGGPIFSPFSGRVLGVIGARKSEPIASGQISLPENYSSGFNISGLDPVRLTVDLYNDTLRNASIISQAGDGIGYSVDRIRELILDLKL